MKKHASKIFIVLLFLAGLSLPLYPFIANQWNTYRQKRLMSNYDEVVAEKEVAGLIDYEQEWELANAYNEGLLPSILPDAFAEAEASKINGEDEAYQLCLNITGNGMMGTVEIPKIKVKLPIFHGTEDDVLEKAAGHLEGSSLPVGGENTHAVITAHRGLPSAKLFTDLDKMKKGDHFLIHVLDDTLCYQVDQITIIEPEDTEALSVVEGMDLVTLVTCTPYGVNSHRLLVRGHRIPYDGELESTPVDSMVQAIQNYYMLFLLLGLGVTALAIFVMQLQDEEKSLLQAQKEKTENGTAVGAEPGTDTETEPKMEKETERENRKEGES